MISIKDKEKIEKALGLATEIKSLLGSIEYEESNEDRPSKNEPAKKLLWYPDAITTGTKMPTKGKYRKGYPEGAVVHFTAGRSLLGLKNALGTVDYGAKQGYVYFAIANTGEIVQTFPLDEWGSHAGQSRHSNLGEGLSRYLVGIEICSAGMVKKISDDKYEAWFKEVYPKEFVRYSEEKENIIKGYYHKYTEAQETALTELLIWLKLNNPEVFNFDLVIGHDEACFPKGRKNDPGAALSMTMPEFRAKLKSEYQKRLIG